MEHDLTYISNFDIDSILHALETKNPKFKFLGSFPCDFQELPYADKRFTIDIDDLNEKGYSTLGIVINTGSSKTHGQYWSSLYIDIDQQSIYFIDIRGTPIPKYLIGYINRIGCAKYKIQWKKEECDFIYPIVYIAQMVDLSITTLDGLFR